MYQQLSNIIIAVILSATVLYGLGALEKKELTYATVHFDGGYKKIGEIAEQHTFSKIKMTMGKEEYFNADIQKIVSEMKQSMAMNPDMQHLKAGIKIEGNVGVSWVGSEGSFELTTDTISLLSTEQQPINIKDLITKLENLEATAKAKNQEYADKALTFSEAPKNSFLLSKLLSALRS